ncbi:MAG TPA: RagB/SusD family nutrient uptake outer membrane protein [Chitinophagaceae bacterium]|nr:RagB/SusD family nutrient uptake outer membrane protein [Chitinophagaceae bacterium]
MKKIKLFLLVLILLTGGLSCKKDFLDEKPLDFLSTANAFQTAADFQASVNNLYRLVREEFYTLNDFEVFNYQYITDLAIDVTAATPNLVATISPTSSIMANHWTRLYKIVAEANTVTSRIPSSKLSEKDRKLFEARGRFFRALAYRTLAYLYGGVPLVTEEITAPKVDFTRATRKEVYAQVIQDLEFAAANLPSLNAGSSAIKDGEVSSQAANHLLAEVYIADGQFQKAVDAATLVINSPNVALMTSRFNLGNTPKDQNGVTAPGDVYADLFRVGNQNRGGGNREAILVVQIQANVPGGAGATNLGFANAGGYCLERTHVPLMRDVAVPVTYQDASGATKTTDMPIFNWPAGDYSSGGRGVGFMGPSFWFQDSIWRNSNNDIRNANHNFARVFKSTFPGKTVSGVFVPNPYYNQNIDFYNLPTGFKGSNGVTLQSGKPSRAMYAFQMKATTPYQHPQELYDPINRQWPFSLKDGAAFTFRDEYMFRLAETYLLRAEAYLGLNNTTTAAADINVVRARANATPVLPGNVNIDYILDERMRELGVEEKRLLTLMRLGKWYDRVVKCNSYYAPQANTKYNLWPIPQAEIERNREAVLDQNPGY